MVEFAKPRVFGQEEPQSVIPSLGHPLEGTPESLIIHGDRKAFGRLKSNIVKRRPDDLPEPRDFDQLSLLGKAGRTLSVPGALVAAVANPASSPRLADILALDTTFTWGEALRHRGWSRRDAAIAGLTLDVGADPLWFLDFAPLTKLGVVARYYSKAKRLGPILKKNLVIVKGLDDVPGGPVDLLKGFEIAKGSEMAKKVAAYQEAGMDLHYGMNWYDQVMKGQRTLIGLSLPFKTSRGAIPLLPRQISTMAFGLPRSMRKTFMAGAEKISVPGDPQRTLADLVVTSFMKDVDPIIKETSYLFRGIKKFQEGKIHKEVVERFNKELQKVDSDIIDELIHAYESRKAFGLTGSDFSVDEFLKAGLPKRVAENKTVQGFMKSMRNGLKNILNAEQEFAALKVTELEDPMNYILHLLTPDAMAKLRKSPLYSRLPELWGKGHGSVIQRRLRKMTILEVNKLGKQGKIPGLEGIIFDKFFETNPVVLLHTRMLRGIRSITGAAYARTAGELVGKKIPAGPSSDLRASVRTMARQVSKIQKRKTRALRQRANLRREVRNLEKVAKQAKVKKPPRTLQARRAALKKVEKEFDRQELFLEEAKAALAGPAKEFRDINGVRRVAVEKLKEVGGDWQSKSPFLADYRFPTKALRDEVDKVFGKVDKVESMSDWWRYYDAALATWKGTTLAPFPAYHFRNWVDNMWRNYLAGMPPVYYYYARKGLGHFDRDKAAFAKLAAKNIFGKPNPRGESFTFAGLLDEFTTVGMAEMSMRHEDVLVKAAPGQIKNLSGHLKNVINPLSTQRPITGKIFDWARATYENPARFAHYMWRRQLGDSPLEAKLSVQKFLFDYEEMDKNVRRKLGRVFPFISWMRFNMPFQFQQIIFNTRRIAPFGHIQNSQIIPALLSKDDRELEAKFLVDWQREGSPFFIRNDPKDPDKFEYLMLDGWSSSLDVLRLMDPLRYFIGMLGPVLREPFQQVSNMDFTFRRPITTFAGVTDVTLETEDYLGMPVQRRLAHALRNIRAFSEVDRVLKRMADKNTPAEKWEVAFQRLILGGGFQEVSQVRAIRNVRFRTQRIAADTRRAYLRAIRRGRYEEAWNIQAAGYANMIRGFKK